MKQKLIDLAARRDSALNRAEAALKDGKQEDYTSAMQEVSNLNTEIQQTQDLLKEQERKLLEQQPTGAEARDMAEERGAILQKGGEVRRAVFNSTTLATGTLVEPAGAGSTIREPLGNIPSSIVDQVYVQDLTGLGSYSEPYVISEFEATGGDVKTNAGKARAASDDPVFGVAEIKPYELTTTSFVDRNISRLSPAAYFDKIHQMAMRGMRRKLAKLIINGDGQATPAMFGVLNAKNKAGASIFADLGTVTVDANLLDSFFYAYGSDDAIGPNARLYLTKEELKAIGKLRNTNLERVFKVRPDGSNPNIGTIEDSGVFIPYAICSDRIPGSRWRF